MAVQEIIEQLVSNHVASRVSKKDATLYDFSAEAQACAEKFMGWADVAALTDSELCSLDKIQEFADAAVGGSIDPVLSRGIESVVLIGQGGSTQAPMTLTKYHVNCGNRVTFRTLDSVSPVRVRQILSELDPIKTLIIVASKSGSTIEPRLLLQAVRELFRKRMKEEDLVRHLVAITDPGSQVEKQAREEGWLAIFNGEPTVGGRFSALSVFGLVPAALAGIDIHKLVERTIKAQERMSQDSPDNPAIDLAAFLYQSFLDNRCILSFFGPKRARVLGLWVEQLVAESLGKNGVGILPALEVDPLLLSEDHGDRSVVVYESCFGKGKRDQTASSGEIAGAMKDARHNYASSVACISNDIPRRSYKMREIEDVAEQFLMWEYAVAMAGYLMKVCPFDQPDVASAKAAVLKILGEGQPVPDFTVPFGCNDLGGTVEVSVSEALKAARAEEGAPNTLESVLRSLINSIGVGDYFALNAFIPFTGEGRKEALEAMRHEVGVARGVSASLEIGPRYLHSTGQLQKGGPNTGVILLVSASEENDIALPAEAESLGALAKAQAAGDFAILSERGRRAVHVHLPDNTAACLRLLMSALCKGLYD